MTDEIHKTIQRFKSNTFKQFCWIKQEFEQIIHRKVVQKILLKYVYNVEFPIQIDDDENFEFFQEQTKLIVENMPKIMSLDIFSEGEVAGLQAAKQLSSGFLNLYSLQQLNCNFEVNNLQQIGVYQLFKGLNKLINLKYFSLILRNNQINSEPTIEIKKWLTHQQQLEYLEFDIGENNIGKEGIKNISEGLISLKNTLKQTILDFQQTNSGVFVFFYTGLALKCLQNLNYLFLNLQDTLNESTDIELDELNIEKESPISQYSKQSLGCYFLSNGIQNLKNTKKINLNLARNKLNDESLMQLQNGLKQLENLTFFHLVLQENSFGSQGVKNLSLAFEKLVKIEKLYLSMSNNDIGDEGIKYLNRGVSHMFCMKNLYLTLQNCKLGEQAGEFILKDLYKFEKLESIRIYLDYNNLSDNGCQYIGQNLEKIKLLTSLSLCISSNNIGNLGFQYLLNSFGSFKKIEDITLQMNGNTMDFNDDSVSINLFQEFIKRIQSFRIWFTQNLIEENQKQELFKIKEDQKKNNNNSIQLYI